MKNPTGVTIVIILILLGSAILITSGKVPGIPGLPDFLKPLTIDENWYVVYNDRDNYDSWSANELRDETGATLISIYTSRVDELNTEGQNLLFIGGGEEFAGKVPWIETWPTLSVIQPGGFPDVYFMNDGTWANWYIHTPMGKCDIVKEGEWLHDYGLIGKGYDSELKRWIIVALGYTAACTGASTVILIEDFGRIRGQSWIVYEIPRETWEDHQNVDLWRPAIFKPQIIASG